MKLFNVTFKFLHEGSIQVAGPSEEEVLAAISNNLANELEQFQITEVEVLVDDLDEAMLVTTPHGALN